MATPNFNAPNPEDNANLGRTNHDILEGTPVPETPTVDNSYGGVDVFTYTSPLATEFITGPAGTGKTTEIRNRRTADPAGVVVAATTGIAAVNLGPEVTTVHSLLKFFDYNSLVDAYENGKLHYNIRRLTDEGVHELIVDEISMFSGPAMDVLYNACNEVSRTNGHPMALTVVGDFCQLPPIADAGTPETGRYAFESNCWRPNFSENTTRLTHVWRQDNPDFLQALHAARRGVGEEALAYLQRAGVRFEPRLSDAFDGTTLCATNGVVDDYNWRRLGQLPGDNTRIRATPSTRWSQDRYEPSEWKSIPDQFAFKPGAYVMILSNETQAFNWVNGDCGTAIGTDGNQVVVRLRRNNTEVRIGKIIRKVTTPKKPSGVHDRDVIVVRDEREYDSLAGANGEPPRQVVMFREPHPTWVTGWIRYMPLRLAYATTVHKSQGLSLDAIQLDLGSGFLASPSMMYVALSRCRTPEGLVLVGNPEHVVTKTNVDPRVIEWL